ncbi:multidrug effflux MFS transporter [Enemella sp. A6]|uniref:multidrug effflux MFS transporter n=1 Tax=Enemella sp. A6 TaxID=3440152 RepID=UPI003EBFBBE1
MSAAPEVGYSEWKPRYLRVVLTFGALMAITPLTIDMYLPGVPALVTELGASTSQGAATVSGMLIGMSVGQILVGPLVDAWGRHRPIMVGLVLHALLSVAIAFAPTIEILLALRVVQGLVGAMLTVTVTASVRDLYSGRKAAALFSQLMLVLGVAPILAPALGSLVLQFTSWRGIFVVLAVITALLFLLTVFGVRETLPRHRRRTAGLKSSLSTYWLLLRDPAYVAMLVVGAMTSAATFTYIAASPFIFQGIFGLSEGSYALIFGINASVTILMVQLNPVMLRRFNPGPIMAVALVLALVTSTILTVTSQLRVGGVLMLAAMVALTNGFSALAVPNAQAVALHRHGAHAGSAAALMGTARFAIAGFAGPVVGFFLRDTPAPLGVMMALAHVIALVALGLSWKAVNAEQY